MKRVGIFEAKTNLSRLIEQVEKGQDVTITRNGKPVAQLVPVTQEPRRDAAEFTPQKIERRQQALKRLREIANELKINPTQAEIKSWINEGRR
jgi:prevent-host-death family protein